MQRAEHAAEQSVTDDGSAVGSLDPVDVVRGLAHLDVLRDRIYSRPVSVHRLARTQPRTAAERHLWDHGHRLARGCCAPDAERAA
jgi:hypothetical protein